MIKLRSEHIEINKNGRMESNCRSIVFIRLTGAAPVSINNFPLQEDQPFMISNNRGEMETTVFNIVFGAGTKSLHVWKQFDI